MKAGGSLVSRFFNKFHRVGFGCPANLQPHILEKTLYYCKSQPGTHDGQLPAAPQCGFAAASLFFSDDVYDHDLRRGQQAHGRANVAGSVANIETAAAFELLEAPVVVREDVARIEAGEQLASMCVAR